jgi:hypothetical protein
MYLVFRKTGSSPPLYWSEQCAKISIRDGCTPNLQDATAFRLTVGHGKLVLEPELPPRVDHNFEPMQITYNLT